MSQVRVALSLREEVIHYYEEDPDYIHGRSGDGGDQNIVGERKTEGVKPIEQQ